MSFAPNRFSSAASARVAVGADRSRLRAPPATLPASAIATNVRKLRRWSVVIGGSPRISRRIDGRPRCSHGARGLTTTHGRSEPWLRKMTRWKVCTSFVLAGKRPPGLLSRAMAVPHERRCHSPANGALSPRAASTPIKCERSQLRVSDCRTRSRHSRTLRAEISPRCW